MDVACSHCGAALQVEGQPSETTCSYCQHVTKVAQVVEHARQGQAHQAARRKGTIFGIACAAFFALLSTILNLCSPHPNPDQPAGETGALGHGALSRPPG